MPTRSVLISGASIAGPALAYWLHRYGFRTTIVERADPMTAYDAWMIERRQDLPFETEARVGSVVISVLTGDMRAGYRPRLPFAEWQNRHWACMMALCG